MLAKRVNARNRVDDAAPTLSYDEEYFQRFEPLSVGDMMKRVPGVSFQSDIGEYAEPSLRGIGSEYTQILVNGRRVTGGTNDNTVVVDRIPAELVERVEIIRSPSSDIDSQGVGGTLNIILKEGAELSGGIYRVGAYYNDGETNPERIPVVRRYQRQRASGALRSTTRSASTARPQTDIERALDGEGGAEPAFSAVVEGPGRAREHRHRLDRRRARADRRGREWFAGAFYMDTDRAETEIGREFAAEDDDGEFEDEARAGQPARRIPGDELRRLHRLREPFRRSAIPGKSSSATTRPNSSRVETNWEDDLDFDFDAAASTTPMTSCRSSTNPTRTSSTSSQSVPHNADDLRDPEFLDEPGSHRCRRLRAQAQVVRRIRARRLKLKLGLEGVDKQRDFSFRVFENEDGVLEEDDDRAVDCSTPRTSARTASSSGPWTSATP